MTDGGKTENLGAIVNDSRNLAVKLNTILDNEDSYNRNFLEKVFRISAFVRQNIYQKNQQNLPLDENYNGCFLQKRAASANFFN